METWAVLGAPSTSDEVHRCSKLFPLCFDLLGCVKACKLGNMMRDPSFQTYSGLPTSCTFWRILSAEPNMEHFVISAYP